MTIADDYYLTTADLVQKFGVHKTTIRKRAKALNLGIDLEGRAGYRYSDADVRKLVESMRPVSVPAPRKRKRAA